MFSFFFFLKPFVLRSCLKGLAIMVSIVFFPVFFSGFIFCFLERASILVL